MSNHYWIRAARRRDRERIVGNLDLPPVLAVLDAHRRLRGPYTAAGALVRLIAADALARRPELGAAYNIELSTSAPELVAVLPRTWTSLEWEVAAGERTRFYSRLHTLNIANGLAEFLRDYLRAVGGGPRSLIVENLHKADPTDQEFVAVLLRRTDLGELTVVAGTGLEPVVDPPGESTISLVRILLTHAKALDGVGVPAGDEAVSETDAATLARAYTEGDGVSDDPRLLAAYQRLPAAERTALHDERAAALAASDQRSLQLGALPYHAEHGSDPCGRGLASLKEAMNHCRGIGLYQAAVDLGLRGRAVVDRVTQQKLWWDFTEATSTCLASLGRADEAEAMYVEARAATQEPAHHMQLAYGMAMLYARHYPEAQRDNQQARAWMNLSIAIASMLEDPKERAFHSVFSDNGLALVETRQKNPGEALRLLEDGIARLDEELAPNEHALHRLVLRYNRAQVFGMTGRLEEALADYVAVVEADPDFPEHHFNVGNILRRLGRNQEAIAAYERALEKSPPFPEAFYNRGDARLEIGDVHGALIDFGHTVQLDPDRVDARANLAGLHYELGDFDAAWQAVTAGVALAPKHVHLLCLHARLLAERGRVEEARQATSAAVRINPQLSEVWAVRGELAYQAGDLVQAASDFDRAVELGDGPALRFNRAVVHQEAGRFGKAVVDYEAVLAVAPDTEAAQRLQTCLAA
jgi:tetratricopeptide (TPR) repeat protein